MSGLVKCLPYTCFAPTSSPLVFKSPVRGREQRADRVRSHCADGPELPLAIFAFLAFLSSSESWSTYLSVSGR
jgi:hypothetical protein